MNNMTIDMCILYCTFCLMCTITGGYFYHKGNPTRGDVLFYIIMSILPFSNAILAVFSFHSMIYRMDWFYKPMKG